MARKKRQESGAPPVSDILAKFKTAETYWGPLHNQMERGNKIFNLELPVTAPAGYNVIYPGTGNTVVMTAADHITGDAPKVKVPEAGLKKDAQRRSEVLEKGLQAALYRFDATTTENTQRTIVINGLWSGMMVSQGPIFNGEAWGLEPIAEEYDSVASYNEDRDGYDTDKRVNWPFLWWAPDPRHVYPDPGTTGKKWVIVHFERIVGEIRAQWPSAKLNGSDGKPLPDDFKMQWYEYWDENYRVYIAGNEELDSRKHRYGKPPFQIRSTGYGNDSSPRPEQRFRAIFWAAESLIQAEIGAFSHRDALIRKTAWSTMLAPINSNFKSLEPGTIQYDQRENLENPAMIRSVSEINPIAIQSVSQEIQELDFEIQKATVPNVVQGIRAKGISSGYGQNSLVAQAKVKYGAAVRNLTTLMQEFLVDLAHCVEYVVQDDVPVWGHTKWGMMDAVLNPTDIDGLKYVVVTINPKLPADRANEIEIGGVLLDRGVIDTDFYLQEYVGVENPGEMRIRVMRDRALQAPEIQRVMSLWAALDGGFIDEVLKMAVAIGMDPGMLLAILGFGTPQQQTPATNQGAGAPQNVAAQRQGGSATMFGGAQKSQPAPGSPSDVRNQAAPGVPIGG